MFVERGRMTALSKPGQVNILGVEYRIAYVDNPAEVDIHKRESLWGQIDYWTRTIRVYDNGRPTEDIWQTLLHEVLHGIAEALHLKALTDSANHDQLDLVALALADVLFRNGWLSTGDSA
jgi:hypothetical protein